MPVRTGTATVSDDALLAMVEGAVASVDGARLDRPRRVTRVLPGRRAGVDWRRDGAALRIEVDIVARYGRVLPDVASEVQQAIAAAVTAMTALPVHSVDVTVTGVERAAGVS
jgi:uncharacterized alkaline shock family protein YloU